MFNIGDKVIHWPHGPGEIVLIEERPIHGQVTNCYVVRTANMTIWVPIDMERQQSIRSATPPAEFSRLLQILSGPGEPLPEDRAIRKDLLTARMREGQMSSIFHVVRDLTTYKRSAKLNDNERGILEKAITALLEEWVSSLGVTHAQAQHDMYALLEG